MYWQAKRIWQAKRVWQSLNAPQMDLDRHP